MPLSKVRSPHFPDFVDVLKYTNLVVIGETTVSPSSIIYLLVKLRLSPPGSKGTSTSTEITKKELSVDETKKLVQRNHESDEKFLESKLDAEEVAADKVNGSAHAPHWPGVRFSSSYVLQCLNFVSRFANLHGGSF